jgi:hypothetical protein
MQDKAARQRIMHTFELRRPPGYEIKQRLTNYRYILHDHVHGCERSAIILQDSWSYYEVRLHRSQKGIDLLIVERHNAVVPCTVLELETGKEYRPGSVPQIERTDRKKPNHEEVNLFVSKLLIGLQGAYEDLSKLPRRTQQRYIERRDALLTPKVGRPWAS